MGALLSGSGRKDDADIRPRFFNSNATRRQRSIPSPKVSAIYASVGVRPSRVIKS